MTEHFLVAQWITNVFAFSDGIALALAFFFLLKIMRPYFKKHKVQIEYRYFYPAIVLLVVHAGLWFLIQYYELSISFYPVVIFADLLLVVAGLIVYKFTEQVLEKTRGLTSAA